MNKQTQILEVSDPQKVRKLAHLLLGENTEILLSTIKNKKYMVQNPNGKMIHFGDMRYEDYTKHKDIKRRERFRQRNKYWESSYFWTPAYLSWYLLW